ncbi:hypothetical protein OG252_13055 [Streptomyces sp. NBC_01352]|uniref:hypothetical protein n=1 Tax=Streptomyces sp. NBC_01352 TaxID=2903834 RepID=UPI002E32FCFC|nr:hypothetical protein [Streptomyces sp. NBC_01352]
MAMISGALKWYTVAARLEQAIHAELTVSPARHGVVPGAIAWDECDCGMLAVSVNQIYPTEQFPNPALTRVGNSCDAPWEAAEIVMQIVRCAPNPDGQLTAPTTAELDASAREVLTDAYEMMRAVSTTLCQMNQDREISDYLMRPLTAQGPTGGCVGNEVRAFVSLPRN